MKRFLSWSIFLLVAATPFAFAYDLTPGGSDQLLLTLYNSGSLTSASDNTLSLPPSGGEFWFQTDIIYT